MTDQKELTAPDEITPEFIAKVATAMGMRDPVAPNAIYQCLVWSLRRIADLETKLATIQDVVLKTVEPKAGSQ